MDAVESLVTFLSGLFPTTNLTDPSSGWPQVLGNLAAINYFLPVSELFAFTLAFFAGLVPLVTVTIVVWIAAFIRGGSARG
jgi:hypothetical protein